MAHQVYSKLLDYASGAQLKDSYAVTSSAAGQVASQAAVYDVGADNAFCTFAIVIDISALTVGTGQYVDIYVEGATTTAFSSVFRLCQRTVGDTASIGQPFDTTVPNRLVIYGDNVIQAAATTQAESTARYIRVYSNINGASCSITYQAWIVPIQ